MSALAEVPMSGEVARLAEVPKPVEVPRFIEASDPVETLSPVGAPNPAETPNPPDADDSAASPNTATRASTTFFLLIFMLILQVFNIVFEKIEAAAGQWRLMKQTRQLRGYRR
jgi:hypothetical protein